MDPLLLRAARRFDTGLNARTEDRLTEIVFETIQVTVVLLADVLGQLAAVAPRNVPRHREGLGVRTGIVDGRLIVQRLFARTRPPLGHEHLVGVRMPEVIEPAVLVEPGVLDDERVLAFPVPD